MPSSLSFCLLYSLSASFTPTLPPLLHICLPHSLSASFTPSLPPLLPISLLHSLSASFTHFMPHSLIIFLLTPHSLYTCLLPFSSASFFSLIAPFPPFPPHPLTFSLRPPSLSPALFHNFFPSLTTCFIYLESATIGTKPRLYMRHSAQSRFSNVDTKDKVFKLSLIYV